MLLNPKHDDANLKLRISALVLRVYSFCFLPIAKEKIHGSFLNNYGKPL